MKDPDGWASAGHGRILRDPALAAQLWTPAQTASSRGIGDAHLSSLRVTPQCAECWETRGRVSYLIAALAATVTGKPAAVGRGHKLP